MEEFQRWVYFAVTIGTAVLCRACINGHDYGGAAVSALISIGASCWGCAARINAFIEARKR